MRRTLLVPFLLLLPLFVAAQTYVNDFEGQSALPWYNVNVETDSLGNHVCHCSKDSGGANSWPIGDDYSLNRLRIAPRQFCVHWFLDK